ncbi:hypothetical protein N1I86_01465 [Bacillus sp. FSL W8-0116]|uniref:hypothetical protein n=1 Tax=Bacillus sp. FSL W8-0116 TaxID=2978206 RepID=UPI0030FBE5AA
MPANGCSNDMKSFNLIKRRKKMMKSGILILGFSVLKLLIQRLFAPKKKGVC